MKPRYLRTALLATCIALVTACARPVTDLPTHKLEALRAESMGALPPEEPGPFRDSDLVEVVTLEPTLRLDVRYATTHNMLRWPVYGDARVFLQRPAAEAVVRAHRALQPQGYGLQLFDGYRPWYVTRIFWYAVPDDKRAFVANPEQGSRHNRGCAVDLTLYDLATGDEVAMPSDYDDFSERAHPDYAGGSAAQRAARDLLRRTMAAEGFTVNDREWWHYDCRDWQQYRIENVPFKAIHAR